ncbi:hypothetical protein BU16DRAFT_161569 [Lophium mytilinum]|uniref:Uncharacterized protein n=1 Tax=Lophium mytilinum TaxID=390894 RepID=A0A6A6QC21_9PEZI|nr:hypothetical protein BU16DRAFT_161569 [Lophium mytilinum]
MYFMSHFARSVMLLRILMCRVRSRTTNLDVEVGLGRISFLLKLSSLWETIQDCFRREQTQFDDPRSEWICEYGAFYKSKSMDLLLYY